MAMTAADEAGLSGRIDATGAHSLRLRVYYEDTDAGGIVYHASFLRFMERGRTELVRLVGGGHTGLRQATGLMFAVRRVVVDYLAPARLDDVLDIETRVTAMGGASFDLAQAVRRDGRDLARGDVKVAMIDCNGRPARIPPALRAALAFPSQRQE
jgi:acyl-CoA thioester hydrolase